MTIFLANVRGFYADSTAFPAGKSRADFIDTSTIHG
jgi:hypothetical protein